MKATFCTDFVLKKLYGKVVIDVGKLHDASYSKACLALMSSILGIVVLHFRGKDDKHALNKFLPRIDEPKAIWYVIYTNFKSVPAHSYFPNCAFSYRPKPNSTKIDCMQYRPAVLNGRHVVDVIRAVCGPADVSEAELDRARRQATENAFDMQLLPFMGGLEGVWCARWLSSPLTG